MRKKHPKTSDPAVRSSALFGCPFCGHAPTLGQNGIRKTWDMGCWHCLRAFTPPLPTKEAAIRFWQRDADDLRTAKVYLSGVNFIQEDFKRIAEKYYPNAPAQRPPAAGL